MAMTIKNFIESAQKAIDDAIKPTYSVHILNKSIRSKVIKTFKLQVPQSILRISQEAYSALKPTSIYTAMGILARGVVPLEDLTFGFIDESPLFRVRVVPEKMGVLDNRKMRAIITIRSSDAKSNAKIHIPISFWDDSGKYFVEGVMFDCEYYSVQDFCKHFTSQNDIKILAEMIMISWGKIQDFLLTSEGRKYLRTGTDITEYPESSDNTNRKDNNIRVYSKKLYVVGNNNESEDEIKSDEIEAIADKKAKEISCECYYVRPFVRHRRYIDKKTGEEKIRVEYVNGFWKGKERNNPEARRRYLRMMRNLLIELRKQNINPETLIEI